MQHLSPPLRHSALPAGTKLQLLGVLLLLAESSKGQPTSETVLCSNLLGNWRCLKDSSKLGIDN